MAMIHVTCNSVIRHPSVVCPVSIIVKELVIEQPVSSSNHKSNFFGVVWGDVQ